MLIRGSTEGEVVNDLKKIKSRALLELLEEETVQIKEDLTKIAKVDAVLGQRVLSKINWLSKNCNLVRHQSLSGDLAGFYKLRVGDYRVIYMIDSYKQSIDICFIGHRKDVYRQ